MNADEAATLHSRRDTKRVLRIATGMTALARVLIGMRQAETGASQDETLAAIGRRIQTLLLGSGWVICTVLGR